VFVRKISPEFAGDLTMYRPNFCADCGEKIFRLKWRVWTSRCFCDPCARRLRQARYRTPLLSTLVLLVLGFSFGRAGRPESPPLLIERPANSHLDSEPKVLPNSVSESPAKPEPSAGQATVESEPKPAPREVYFCGARTRKGSPCSRRVPGPTRCWQHLGAPAMLPQEKLLLKN